MISVVLTLWQNALSTEGFKSDLNISQSKIAFTDNKMWIILNVDDHSIIS